MTRLTCPSCGGLLPDPDAPCPRCGHGRADSPAGFGSQTTWEVLLAVSSSMAFGVVLLLGGPFLIWLWDRLGGEPTWGWLAALLCAGAGLAALARGGRILVDYILWRRR